MAQTPDISRRLFLRVLGLGTAGATIGGALAWAESEVAARAALEGDLAGLQAQLGAAHTQQLALDNSVTALSGQTSSLTAQLDAAWGQNTQLSEALRQAQTQAETLQAQLTEAQAQLAGAQERLSQHQTVLSLYDQLENIGLDGLALAGLQAAAGSLTAALGIAPLLRGGLETARRLLGEFEQVLPDFQAGMTWLGGQVINLKLGLFALEKAAQPVVNAAATGVVALFGGFIKVVVDYLPFEAGAKMRAAFTATQTLIAHSTDLAEAADEQMLGKLSRYVSGGARSWQHQLLPPLRQETLAPAEQMLTAVDGAQHTFETALRAPVQNALTLRAEVRQRIAEYRAAHHV